MRVYPGIFAAMILREAGLVLILLLCYHMLFSQTDGDRISYTDSQNVLFKKYLSKKGNEDQKIETLISEALKASDAGDFPTALRKYQLGFILEKQIRPSLTTFKLNFYAGLLVANINREYSLEFFRKATAIIHAVNDMTPFYKYQLFTNRAGAHASVMENDSARYYYLLAIGQARLENNVSEASTINNLGMFYSDIGIADSARYYFHKALERLGEKENHITLYASIRDNLALLLMQENEFALAERIFRENDTIYFLKGWEEPYVINKVKWLKTLQHISSERLPPEIEKLQEYIRIHHTAVDDKYILEFYEFANDFYHQSKPYNIQKISLYRSLYREWDKKIEERNFQRVNDLAKALLAIQENSMKADIEAYQLRTQRQKEKLFASISISIAAVISSLLIIWTLIMHLRRKKLEMKTEQALMEAEIKNKAMEAKLLQQDLELKKRDLTNIVLHNTQVYDSNQKIIDRLQEISSNKEPSPQLRTLLVELQTQNQISDRSIALQANIESVNEEFYEKLRRRFPGLTRAEAELCGYIRIKLSNKDISILKNVESASVKMGKNRLRKKLGIEPEADLYEFLKHI